MASDDESRAAISNMFEGRIVTSYLVIAELLDEKTGERIIAATTPDDMPVWQRLGLLEFVRARERFVVECIFDQDEDD